ncbi:MAG: hypothetical protein ACREDM_14625 [Methylocella sp.]
MPRAPRINGVPHRVTFAAVWESPRSQVLGRLGLYMRLPRQVFFAFPRLLGWPLSMVPYDIQHAAGVNSPGRRWHWPIGRRDG